MIHEFAIENVLSFKDEQVISFEASSDKTYEEYHVVKKGNLRLLKLLLLYGANGSGKTNILLALEMLKDVILDKKNDKNEPVAVVPFLLDKTSRNKPSTFYLSFFIEQTRFIYSLVTDTERILSEKLSFYPKTKPALLFERSYNQEKSVSVIHFGDKTTLSQDERKVLMGITIPNQSVIASYASTNVSSPILDDVFRFFTRSLCNLIEPGIDLLAFSTELFTANGTNRDFMVQVMQAAGFGFEDIEAKKDYASIPEEIMTTLTTSTYSGFDEYADVVTTLMDQVSGKLAKNDIYFKFKTDQGHSELSFTEMSSGTQRYFELTGPLHQLVNQHAILPIDEIESSLHQDLVNTFLQTFLANSASGQLIAATHNIHLLDEDYIRRDNVWFVELNDQFVSEVYPLRAFKIHKNTSIFNAYKVGKFGAKPDTKAVYRMN